MVSGVKLPRSVPIGKSSAVACPPVFLISPPPNMPDPVTMKLFWLKPVIDPLPDVPPTFTSTLFNIKLPFLKFRFLFT